MPVLQFKGKTAVECYHHTVPHHVLEFDPKLSVLGKGEKPGLDGNLIIEGDNLVALKALLPTHAGRIKCIYIDPPYNTGNEGWVYNDNLTQPQFKEWLGQTVGKEGEDATRHDKWCCMMYPRLQLLKELLHEEGAIFVSIDDNEVAPLRLLMDEIFGSENFVANIIWRNSTGPKQSKLFSTSHDYILAFAKKAESWKRNLLPRTPEQEADYDNPDDDPRGPWRFWRAGRQKLLQQGALLDHLPGRPSHRWTTWRKLLEGFRGDPLGIGCRWADLVGRRQEQCPSNKALPQRSPGWAHSANGVGLR